MRYVLFALALVGGTTAVAQATYLPPQVHITRTEPTGVCYAGSINVYARDNVAIGMWLCSASEVPPRGSMALTGDEGPIVLRCLASARAVQTDRDNVYTNCLRAGLQPLGIMVS